MLSLVCKARVEDNDLVMTIESNSEGVYLSDQELRVNAASVYLRNLAYRNGRDEYVSKVFPRVPSNRREHAVVNAEAILTLEGDIPGVTDELNTVLNEFEVVAKGIPVSKIRKLFGKSLYPLKPKNPDITAGNNV